MDLIIVESPSKAKTISKYLKGKYRVDASAGHVRDLPVKSLGVNIKKNYEPKYVVTPGKEEIIKRLKEEAKKADRIFLATDPDREGEAISWHLQTILGMDEKGKNRITFNEISPSAIGKALSEPRQIDYNLVNAQQARRVLDRLVGYKLSPYLNDKIESPVALSAGRVQSVALRLIVDKERDILAFVPKEYWNVAAELQDGEKKFSPFKASLEKKGNRKYSPSSKEECDETLSSLKAGAFVVSKVKKSVSKSHAPAPFTTSTLQQDASNKFGMSSPETMLVAQHLYEGVDAEGEGHVAFISYIRTDSTRISSEAQSAALHYIEEKYGKEYCPSKPNVYATKKGAQDAHEAIRPISVEMTPERAKKLLDKKHYNIYKLIYERFLASQMSEATYNSMQIEVANGNYTLKASGKTPLFSGFTAVYQEEKKEEEEPSSKLLPDLKEGMVLDLVKLSSEQKFTKPPARYTDASLVKEMESNGIGRPSTYASIISVLTKRKYVEKEGKTMKPTPVAYRITDMLMENFKDVMDVGFTADMENKLDGIESGGKDWHEIIAEFYPPFEQRLISAATARDEMTDILCEKCGRPMIRKENKYGKYLACSGYPECSNIIGESSPEVSDKPCPKCGALMVVKSGKFGKFLACPNYPACKSTLPLAEKKEELFDGVCPDCGKPTKRMRSKSGHFYYGCSGYPECKFMSWDKPTGKKCPLCSSPLVETAKGNVKCSSKTCRYKEEKPNASAEESAEEGAKENENE